MTVYNRLFVTPLPQTLDYISKMTEHSPVHIDLNSLRVEIISTLDDVVALPQRVYAAEPSSLTPWYDTALGYSSLIMSFRSGDLDRRALELNQQGILREWFPYYNPHMVLLPHMPPKNLHMRRFLNSIANSFVGNKVELLFGNEYVSEEQLDYVPNVAYNEAQYQEQMQRHGR